MDVVQLAVTGAITGVAVSLVLPRAARDARARRLAQIVAFGGVWLLFVYLQMSAACEGFVEFLLLGLGGAFLSIVLVVLAITRTVTLRRLILCALAMALTLPASIVVGVIEYHFAADHLKTISDALNRYRSDRGAFPDTLSALTPQYLPRIPSAILLLQIRQPGYSRSSPTDFNLHYQLVCGPSVSSEAPPPAKPVD